jgi:hypothetical protein
VPEPPDAVAVQVTLAPGAADDGETEQEPVTGTTGAETVTGEEQLIVTGELEGEEIVTDAVFVPAVL